MDQGYYAWDKTGIATRWLTSQDVSSILLAVMLYEEGQAGAAPDYDCTSPPYLSHDTSDTTQRESDNTMVQGEREGEVGERESRAGVAIPVEPDRLEVKGVEVEGREVEGVAAETILPVGSCSDLTMVERQRETEGEGEGEGDEGTVDMEDSYQEREEREKVVVLSEGEDTEEEERGEEGKEKLGVVHPPSLSTGNPPVTLPVPCVTTPPTSLTVPDSDVPPAAVDTEKTGGDAEDPVTVVYSVPIISSVGSGREGERPVDRDREVLGEVEVPRPCVHTPTPMSSRRASPVRPSATTASGTGDSLSMSCLSGSGGEVGVVSQGSEGGVPVVPLGLKRPRASGERGERRRAGEGGDGASEAAFSQLSAVYTPTRAKRRQVPGARVTRGSGSTFATGRKPLSILSRDTGLTTAATQMSIPASPMDTSTDTLGGSTGSGTAAREKGGGRDVGLTVSSLTSQVDSQKEREEREEREGREVVGGRALSRDDLLPLTIPKNLKLSGQRYSSASSVTGFFADVELSSRAVDHLCERTALFDERLRRIEGKYAEIVRLINEED
ncbi:hypothetical protein KIPB_005132 [Kipferlia bialata]|uniref:Uncharacterized protein n=1 Tax=Kipferlia bialata TaxID=797122 RepID=A0A9K3CVL0_9EUKA|nr:hypothetical protein KIPB_005132 [Kipferlia bialata]|eukprot:g5132.t1